MFNAVNILEALKNYIHTRGGQSAANNIAEAVNDLNSIPHGSGGDIPDEVTNAIETGGMGWTSEEEVSGFDIQWDGNTEGLESLADMLYLVSSVPTEITSVEDLIGATLVISVHGNFDSYVLTEDDIYTSDNKVYLISEEIAVVAFEDGVIPSTDIEVKKGVWFIGVDGVYTSRLYKEASTEEVVHQIDEKYVPQSSGGRMVVKVTADLETLALSADKTFAEIQEAFRAGVNVIANLYAGEEYDSSVICISCGGVMARFGMVFIDEDTSIKYELECYSENGVDEWTSGAF